MHTFLETVELPAEFLDLTQLFIAPHSKKRDLYSSGPAYPIRWRETIKGMTIRRPRQASIEGRLVPQKVTGINRRAVQSSYVRNGLASGNQWSRRCVSIITCNKNGPERIMHQLFYGLSCSCRRHRLLHVQEEVARYKRTVISEIERKLEG
jgi:hypothetical protein